jgi:hypothetical protein
MVLAARARIEVTLVKGFILDYRGDFDECTGFGGLTTGLPLAGC